MKRLKPPPQKGSAAYRRLWRIVDGAVADAFAQHPDYIVPRLARVARNSIVKRVTGAVLGFAEQSAKGRSAKAAPARAPAEAYPAGGGVDESDAESGRRSSLAVRQPGAVHASPGSAEARA